MSERHGSQLDVAFAKDALAKFLARHARMLSGYEQRTLNAALEILRRLETTK